MDAKEWKKQELITFRDDLKYQINALDIKLKDSNDKQNSMTDEKFLLQQKLIEIKKVLSEDYDIFD